LWWPACAAGLSEGRLDPAAFAAQAGRLDVVVANQLELPRADVQRAIAEGRVLVDGRVRPKSFRLRGGESIEAAVPARRDLEPEAIPLTVVFEDEHLLVLSKPAGLVTHPTASRRTGTLVNRLLARGGPLSTLGGEDRPGVVHRLDAGTSGLMVVAKDDATHRALAAMFRVHAVERRYLALVRGPVQHDVFLIDAPLGRQGSRILVRSATGRNAETEVEVRERLARATLVEARPRTGRTHQIRVHLAAIGHPVLGDRAYGGGVVEAARLGLTRPFLHSFGIAFDHPSDGRRVQLEDLLPADLAEALRRARTHAP
jgi:23S rRNA pseudouridine1911/1915/1917 synthase